MFLITLSERIVAANLGVFIVMIGLEIRRFWVVEFLGSLSTVFFAVIPELVLALLLFFVFAAFF